MEKAEVDKTNTAANNEVDEYSNSEDSESIESDSTITNYKSQYSLNLAPDEKIEIINFGELKPGDVILGSKDRTEVTVGFEPHIPESMYLLKTSSGVSFEASGNHLLYVVTANNRDLHRSRLAEGKKLGKSISKESLATLKEVAEDQEMKEALIADFEDFIDPKTPELRSALIRIAESIGPVSESKLYVDDLGEAEDPLYTTTIQNYNRRLFAQQVLSLFNIEKSRKRWPLIVGTVMTVEMLLSYDIEDIYIPNPVQLS